METCNTATGTVVVIDVMRAFTTAAYAFDAGARDVVIVSTVAEALALRERMPGALVMGEVDGLPVAGFDFGNSPPVLVGRDLTGRRLVQRTSQGAQGVVRSTRARVLLAASFVCAGATARYIKHLCPEMVTFVITGAVRERDGDEDAACADYIADLLRGEHPDVTPYLQRVYNSAPGQRFSNPVCSQFPRTDLESCLQVDRFDFAMRVWRQDELFVMETAN